MMAWVLLPPGGRMDVVILEGRPSGPVGGVERDDLLGLGDRNHRQLFEVDLGGFDEELVDLGVAQRQRAHLVDDGAVLVGLFAGPAHGSCRLARSPTGTSHLVLEMSIEAHGSLTEAHICQFICASNLPMLRILVPGAAGLVAVEALMPTAWNCSTRHLRRCAASR